MFPFATTYTFDVPDWLPVLDPVLCGYVAAAVSYLITGAITTRKTIAADRTRPNEKRYFGEATTACCSEAVGGTALLLGWPAMAVYRLVAAAWCGAGSALTWLVVPREKADCRPVIDCNMTFGEPREAGAGAKTLTDAQRRELENGASHAAVPAPKADTAGFVHRTDCKCGRCPARG